MNANWPNPSCVVADNGGRRKCSASDGRFQSSIRAHGHSDEKVSCARRTNRLAIHYRVNAGYIPADHWVNDPEQGGGRILGEVCHFVDFLCFLAGASPIEVQAQTVGNPGQYSMDNVVASLKFANGSLGTISYLANGDKSASKERVEIFGGGSVAILEDFRRLELVRNGRKQITRARWKDKTRATKRKCRHSWMRCGARRRRRFRLNRSSARRSQLCDCRIHARPGSL